MTTQAIKDRIQQDTKIKSAEGRQAETPAVPLANQGKVGEKIYFHPAKNNYYFQDAYGEWIVYTEGSIKRYLRHRKFNAESSKELREWKIEEYLLHLQHNNGVGFAGAVAGFSSGLHHICNQRILATKGPSLIRPKEGEWPILRKFLDELLRDQVRIFYGWIHAAMRSLYAGPPFRPGQMLAIAGEHSCGKSLLQNIITEMFGGRMAKPYAYLTGDEKFNDDILASEHLMIEDEAESTDMRARRTFGSMLKNMCKNEVQRLRGFYRGGLTVTPFWRVTITLNDNAENIAVLPPLDTSISDVVILLRASMATFPYGADDLDGRKRYRQAITKELPAFLAWVKRYRIPPSMQSQRYGITHYHDPVLLKQVEELSPEVSMLNLIDFLQIWGVDREPFCGSSTALQDLLLQKDKSGRAQKLFSFHGSCGQYLARLERYVPERVSSKRDEKTNQKWTIKPPDR